MQVSRERPATMAGRKPLEGGVVASGGDGDGGGAPSAEGDAEKVAMDQGGEEEAGVKPASSSSHKDEDQEKAVAEGVNADVKVAPPQTQRTSDVDGAAPSTGADPPSGAKKSPLSGSATAPQPVSAHQVSDPK